MTIKMISQRTHYDPEARRDRKAGEAFTVADEGAADKLERRRKAKRDEIWGGPAMVNPPRPAAPLSTSETDDIATLRSTYETTVGKRPFMGWSAEELKDKIGLYNRRDMRAQD